MPKWVVHQNPQLPEWISFCNWKFQPTSFWHCSDLVLTKSLLFQILRKIDFWCLWALFPKSCSRIWWLGQLGSTHPNCSFSSNSVSLVIWTTVFSPCPSYSALVLPSLLINSVFGPATNLYLIFIHTSSSKNNLSLTISHFFPRHIWKDFLMPFFSTVEASQWFTVEIFTFPLGNPFHVSLLSAFRFAERNKLARQADSLWAKTLELWGACLPEGWTQFTADLPEFHFVNKCTAGSWLNEKWNSVVIPERPQGCVILTECQFVSLIGYYTGETSK